MPKISRRRLILMLMLMSKCEPALSDVLVAVVVVVCLKAMLHEAIFLATCNATNVALQIARKNSRVTPHFATAIVALRVARKVEGPSTFRDVPRQVVCV